MAGEAETGRGSRAAGREVTASFSPSLVPTARWILCSVDGGLGADMLSLSSTSKWLSGGLWSPTSEATVPVGLGAPDTAVEGGECLYSVGTQATATGARILATDILFATDIRPATDGGASEFERHLRLLDAEVEEQEGEVLPRLGFGGSCAGACFGASEGIGSVPCCGGGSSRIAVLDGEHGRT